MKAVILAGGEGTRLRPFTASEPKVMIPVGNKPILQHVVEALEENGITDIIMVVGYQKSRIMSYFENGDDFDVDIDYVVQSKQLGTAHALYQAKELVEDHFIALPGDNLISPTTVTDFLDECEGYSVLVTKNQEPSKYGVVSMTNGLVDNIIEKPSRSESHLISTGIYSLEPEIFDYIDRIFLEDRYDLTSAINEVKSDHDLHGIYSDSTWMDAVYPWDLISLNYSALRNTPKTSAGDIRKGVTLKGNVKICEGAVIRGGTYIEGPAIIGEGCEIGPMACIMPSTSIGPDCRVGPFSVIGNSILMDGVHIGPQSNIDTSVIGEGVMLGSSFSNNVGSSSKIIEGSLEEIESIGCMIGEDSEIGSGVTVFRGIMIGGDSRVNSGVVIREDVESGSIVT